MAFLLGGLLTLVIVLGIGITAAVGMGAFGTISDYITRDLPAVERAVDGRVFKTAVVYDRKGRPIDEIWDPQSGKRTIVPLHDMPTFLVDATLATEDPRFYENPGFDAAAIARAVWQNLRGQTILSGASTITQQLIKISLIDPEERYEQSYTRKIKEIVLAYQLSSRYTKEQILERYLNEIPYGNLSYGVEAASQTYFGKHVSELTVAQAALIAGLPQAPSLYDPYSNLPDAKARQAEVLGLMVRHGFISHEAAETAEKEDLHIIRNNHEARAPHFSNYVRALLETRYSRENLYYSGMKIETTLDLDIQASAERLVRENRDRLRALGAKNAAVIVIDPKTGEILAMVGSADYWSDEIVGQVNVTVAGRQAGSTLKPFAYVAAFSRGKVQPATALSDDPASFSGGPGQPAYSPPNPDGKYRGQVTARQALAHSLNVPTVRLLSQIGVSAMLDQAREMGISTLNGSADYYGLALALGAGEARLIDLTYAYSTLANSGFQVGEPVPDSERKPGYREYRPVAIRKITDDQGRILEEYRPSGKSVVSPGVAFLVNDILADNATRSQMTGAPIPVALSRPSAIQTGSTDAYRDNWAIGYTPDLAIGVWVGNSNNEPAKEPLAVTGAGMIWKALMEEAHRGIDKHDFERPTGVIRATVDFKTGLRPAPGEPTITDWFIESAVPKGWALPTSTITPIPTRTATPTSTPRPRYSVTGTAKVLTPMASGTPEAIGTLIPGESPTPETTTTPPQAEPTQPPPETTTTPPQAEPTQPPPENASLVTMPNVVGMDEATGLRAFAAAGLGPARINYQTADDVFDKDYFNTFAVGMIVSQQPSSGTKLERGTMVDFAVRKK